MTDRQLHVYVDLNRTPHLVGRLWARRAKNRESATFEYDPAWIANPVRFALEPALALGGGPQHTQHGRVLFGAFGDSAPDRWGRKLIQREERRQAQLKGRAVRSLGEADTCARRGRHRAAGSAAFQRNRRRPVSGGWQGHNRTAKA